MVSRTEASSFPGTTSDPLTLQPAFSSIACIFITMTADASAGTVSKSPLMSPGLPEEHPAVTTSVTTATQYTSLSNIFIINLFGGKFNKNPINRQIDCQQMSVSQYMRSITAPCGLTVTVCLSSVSASPAHSLPTIFPSLSKLLRQPSTSASPLPTGSHLTNVPDHLRHVSTPSF